MSRYARSFSVLALFSPHQFIMFPALLAARVRVKAAWVGFTPSPRDGPPLSTKTQLRACSHFLQMKNSCYVNLYCQYIAAYIVYFCQNIVLRIGKQFLGNYFCAGDIGLYLFQAQ